MLLLCGETVAIYVKLNINLQLLYQNQLIVHKVIWFFYKLWYIIFYVIYISFEEYISDLFEFLCFPILVIYNNSSTLGNIFWG